MHFLDERWDRYSFNQPINLCKMQTMHILYLHHILMLDLLLYPEEWEQWCLFTWHLITKGSRLHSSGSIPPY